MNKAGKLTYLKHSEIDYEKWDQCIIEASNSRVYAASWYLDRTAIVWDALIWGDYEFVMPLPLKKKFRISYLYQPMYCQQLGIFPEPPSKIARLFFEWMLHNFRYLKIQLNSENQPSYRDNKLQVLARENHLLSLNTSYENLAALFSKNTRRNIAKANNNRLNFVEGISLENFLAFKEKNIPDKISNTVLQKLKSIIAYSQYKGFGEIMGVYSSENELCAAVYFCRWKKRLIYLNAVSSSEGKKFRAMFFLIDQLLKATAGKNLVLDFEGSVIPGIARFFEGFGATPETYYQLAQNKLPYPLNKLKN